MGIYKLKHKPTGLYYQPVRADGVDRKQTFQRKERYTKVE